MKCPYCGYQIEDTGIGKCPKCKAAVESEKPKTVKANKENTKKEKE